MVRLVLTIDETIVLALRRRRAGPHPRVVP